MHRMLVTRKSRTEQSISVCEKMAGNLEEVAKLWAEKDGG
jgi:hypothetical protein